MGATEDMIEHWTYRLVRHFDDLTGEVTIGIHEVHYRDNKLWAYTAIPDGCYGDSVDSALALWRKMGRAFEQPVLNHEDFFQGAK